MPAVTPHLTYGGMSFPLTAGATHAAGTTMAHFQNPEDLPIIITECILYDGTASTGAANLTIGNAATVSGGHDRTDIAAAIALNGVSAGARVLMNSGDTADALSVVPADDYIVCSGSADTTGYTGRVYMKYVKAHV